MQDIHASMGIVKTIAGYFDEARYDKLVKGYDIAVRYKWDQFLFDQQTMLTSFAKYLIEYLDSHFKNMK